MIHAGDLTERICIEANNPTRADDFNEPVDRWTVFARRWAKVQQIVPKAAAGEFWSSQKTNADIVTHVWLRMLDGVTSAMRVKYAGRTLGINAVIEEGADALHLVCHEIV